MTKPGCLTKKTAGSLSQRQRKPTFHHLCSVSYRQLVEIGCRQVSVYPATGHISLARRKARVLSLYTHLPTNQMQDRSRPNNRPLLDEQTVLSESKSLRSSDSRFAIDRSRRSARPQSADGPTILVADDSDDTRQMLRTLLGMKGYRVIEASDGEWAVQATQHETPDLVLLDLGLPRLNGLTVIRRLRNELNLTEVPIVVITGYDKHFETAVAAGCNDYLLKPIDFDRLDAILDYYAPTLGAIPVSQHS